LTTSVCGKSAPRKDWKIDLLAICFLSLNSANNYCSHRANRNAGVVIVINHNDYKAIGLNCGASSFDLLIS
jgi:hypothetical protein